MLIDSNFDRLGWQARWPMTLVLLVLISGCSRGRGDRATAPSEAMSEDPAAAAVEMDGDRIPEFAEMSQPESVAESAAMAESAPSHEFAIPPPRMAEAVEAETLRAKATIRPHMTPKRMSRAMSRDTNESFAREEFPMAAAAEEMPSIEMLPTEAPATADRFPRAADDAIPPPGDHLSHLPAGAQHHDEQGFATVQVYYATDRGRGVVPLSSYQVAGQKDAFVALGGFALLLIVFAGACALRGRTRLGAVSALAGGVSACLAAALVVLGQAKLEKHGVTYTGDRGELTRGVCEVTVPDSHQRGLVERPSLLRLEFQENQQQHLVMTSAVELAADDFQIRLAETVAGSPDRDLLVFIHGYNVDFESAVLRTAQISVDLPFEGVPVCYSWPSQGSLLGYSVDENNAEWTVAHLKQFLTELAQQSGAKSINVVAHSMGNRAMTAAMQQISWQVDTESAAPFDRIVLAAPDVDADRFRRDFAPALLSVANQVTLYASSDDQALVASKQVHGYPRAGESGDSIVVVPGIETIDVSGIDLSLLGHSYYGDNESMLRDLYEVVRARLPAPERGLLIPRYAGPLRYWQLAQRQVATGQGPLR